MIGAHRSPDASTKKDNMDQDGMISPKSVDLLSGFFFNINFIVGTGFLGVPYGFYRAGTLTATITLLALSFISWNSANWIVETMARSQAITDWRQADKSNKTLCNDDTGHANKQQPKFQVLLTRKFEIIEMLEVFFGKFMKYAYLVIMSVYMFLSYWSSSTVAGSAWASNLPLNFGSLSQCDDEEFHHNLIPSGGCLGSYRFCIMLFALIVIPLSLLELTEQKFLQVLLGLMRFFTFGCLIVYSVANLISHPGYIPHNTTVTFNSSYHSYSHLIMKFNFKGWILAIPIFVFAQVLHQGIPSLTQPIKAKRWLKVFFGAVFTSTTMLYLSLGVTMSLWFKDRIEETSTLNFVEIAHHHSSSTALRVMAYYIVLFPSLDVCSAYPLGVITISNNIFILLSGSDTTLLYQHKYGKLMLITLRLVCAVLPIIGSLFIANLVFIIKYAGLLGLFICYFFPIVLQLRSQYVCHQTFNSAIPDHHLPVNEELPLLAGSRNVKNSGLGWKEETYYTPYSTVFSHPIIVVIFAVVTMIICGLVVTSLFVVQ